VECGEGVSRCERTAGFLLTVNRLRFVGVLFTSVYAYGVTAGIVDWYRRGQTQPTQAGPSLAG
jgi:hypothetical protein